MEEKNGITTVGEMQIRHRLQTKNERQKKKVRVPGAMQLTRNLSITAALLLCLVALREGALPGAENLTDTVLTMAASDVLLDDHLGKLSFVSKLFPEAQLVFSSTDVEKLLMPVSGGEMVHAWSEAEPFVLLHTENRTVIAPMAGEVIGIYHGDKEERMVQILRDDGVSCLCGNLQTIAVQTGDAVERGDTLGELAQGADCVFELRQDGRSVEPTMFLASAT